MGILICFIRTVIVGLAGGWCAARLMGMNASDWKNNLFMGLIGSFVGGLLGRLIGIGATSIVGSIVISIIGVFVFMWICNKLRK